MGLESGREDFPLAPARRGFFSEKLIDLVPPIAQSAPFTHPPHPVYPAFGVSLDRAFALGGLTRRLDIIGVPLSTL